MSTIVINYNPNLSVEENNKLLDKAKEILEENGISCEGFLTSEEAYYYSQMNAIFDVCASTFNDEEEIKEYVERNRRQEVFAQYAEELSENYDQLEDFSTMVDYVRDNLLRDYFESKITVESIQDREILFDGEKKLIKELDSVEQQLIRGSIISDSVNNQGKVSDTIKVESDEFGLKIEFE